LSLINYFALKFSSEMNRQLPVFSDNVLKAMKAYPWPGNVRELENLIQRLVVIVDGHKIKTTDLPTSMRFNAPTRQTRNQKLEEVVSEHILTVLTSAGGNKTQAAKILGIDRKTLNSKLKKTEDTSHDK
ncbi:sigma-54-dependent Fis family transcriptional regulator, partial [bacterium]|nr:sigma-54-dependent Fis family transcriptional regulator [bacterium]